MLRLEIAGRLRDQGLWPPAYVWKKPVAPPVCPEFSDPNELVRAGIPRAGHPAAALVPGGFAEN